MSAAVRALRLWFRIAERVSPAAAEEQAATLFSTPKRRRGPSLSALRPRLLAEFPAGHPHAEHYDLALHVDGLRLAAWSWGGGPSVLLLHGWGGAATDMASLGAALVRAGYRAVLFDLPAHGRSAGRRTTLVAWLRALRAVGTTVGPFEAIVAHSFGAAAATIALAERRLEARGAVLLAPPIGPSPFVEHFSGLVGLSAARAAGMVRRLEARVGRRVDSLDARRAASVLTMPALVCHDPADPRVSWEQGRAIADAWAGSRFVSCDGLGHGGMLRDPATAATVVDFVRTLPGRAGRRAAGASAMHAEP